MEYFNLMNEACNNEGIILNDEQYNKFILYKDLIKEWNKKINLTSITKDEDIIKKHFIDCIKIYKFSPLKSYKKVIDVGTGAGFPGIPMNIINPKLKITLLDSLNKRIKFLDTVIDELNLSSVNTIHGRAEDYARDINHREKYDAAVSRAVANLTVLSELCLPYVKVGGYFVAMKGPSVEKELKEAKNAISILGASVEDIIKVDIENSNLDHNLVIIKKIKNTSKDYPRKAGTVSKRPLK